MTLKVLLAFGAVLAALATGRRLGVGWNSLLVLTIPAAAAMLPGYIPVIRSHAFTFCFFGATLLGLEDIRAGKNWPAFVLPVVMLIWANTHGGFVAGLGAVVVYTAFAMLTRQRVKLMLLVAFSCAAATLINIYGFKFWGYLIPAILNQRPRIAEWQPLPLFEHDAFLGFRILFVLVVVLLAMAWRRTGKKSWPGLGDAGADRHPRVAQPAARAVLRRGGARVRWSVFENRVVQLCRAPAGTIAQQSQTIVRRGDALRVAGDLHRHEFPAQCLAASARAGRPRPCA
jgi:hypothetical protein